MLSALLTSIVSSSILATAPTPGLELKKFTYAGRGCGVDGFYAVPNPDQPDRFAFQLPNMNVEFGPGVSLIASRSSCTIKLDYVVPEGWQLGVSRISMRGIANLNDKANALLSTQIYFQGQAGQFSYEETVNGPQDGDDIFVDHKAETPLWSKCGGDQSLLINWSARIKPTVSPGAFGIFEFYYDLTEPDQTVDFVWQPC